MKRALGNYLNPSRSINFITLYVISFEKSRRITSSLVTIILLACMVSGFNTRTITMFGKGHVQRSRFVMQLISGVVLCHVEEIYFSNLNRSYYLYLTDNRQNKRKRNYHVDSNTFAGNHDLQHYTHCGLKLPKNVKC